MTQHKERRMIPDRRASASAVTPDEVEEIAKLVADEASDKAVRKVFAILGVDFDDPESIEEFRDNLRFNRRLRKAADHSWLAFVGAVTVVMVAALGWGFKVMLERG